MLKNYLTTAWRNLSKHKLYTSINIVGLAIGMAACVVIALFVFYERSFDQMHTKNIYRLNEVQTYPGMLAPQKVALSMFPMGPTLKEDFPEVLRFTRVNWNDDYQMTYGDKRIYYKHTYFVDTTFLSIFDFPLLKGDRATALLRPNSAVLTESGAKKLFGDADPIGKTINHYAGDTSTFTVTGVLKDIPDNSQFQFEALFSFNTIYKPDWMNNWGGNWLNTYLELAPGTSQEAMTKKFPAYLKKHMDKGGNWKFYQLFLLPLKDVHSNAADIGLDYINYQKFDKNYTNIFMIIALIVLTIACINFMNLATARSTERAKEVGIRKSIGAQRFQLGLQFIGETIMLSLIALVLATLLVFLVLPYIENLSQRNLRPIFPGHPVIIISIVIGSIIVGIVSGIYPAIYLSSFQPSKVLKGGVISSNKKANFRNVLVVGQFVSAIFLIISTIFVFRQLNYMQGKDPGFVRDNMITVSLDDITYPKYDLLKTELSASPLVAGVTACRDQLGGHLDQTGVQFKGDGPLQQISSTILMVDPDYMKVYKMKLAYGRDFSHDKQANGKEFILNEKLAHELLKDKPNADISTLVGKEFGFDSSGRIVGIAKDFNFNSLHYKIETIFLFNEKDYGFGTLSVKVNGDKASQVIALIQKLWQQNFPGHPLQYQLLDDHFKEVYRTDAQITQMVGVLAFLAILISCLGLFGLASYSAERRIKEIGVRKVLGASMSNIVGLLSKHFIKLVLIANAIAWPLAYYSVNKWMEDYAYRLNMSWWVFVVSGVAALAIALITVSVLAMKAASANPVKSLRTE